MSGALVSVVGLAMATQTSLMPAQLAEVSAQQVGFTEQPTFATTYDAANASGGLYSGQLDIFGYAPLNSGPGPYPLFMYMPGTDNMGDRHFMARDMARRGYFSVVVVYPEIFSISYRFLNKADTVAGTSAATPLSILCELPQVDCDAGIAVLGYSQGTHIAVLLAAFSHRITAAYMIEGSRPTINGTFTLCDNTNLETLLPRNKRRYMTGANDEYYAWIAGQDFIGGYPIPSVAGAMHNLKLASGYDCGAQLNCLQPDGSGYYVTTHNDTGGDTADHYSWMNFTGANTTAGIFGRPADWFANAPVFGLEVSLDWLATAARTGARGKALSL